jgi:hypothetical protein
MADEKEPAIEPNLYELSGDGITVTYESQPVVGPPRFNYEDKKHGHLSTGKDIHTVDTEIGTLVSAIIYDFRPGSGSISFSVLLPKIRLGKSTSEPITTIGITTAPKVREPAPHGQNELYTVHPMRGKASFVRS